MVAEEERILEVLRDAARELNVGQFTDTEATEKAFQLGLIERSYVGVHTIFKMLALPKVVLTSKAHDWLEEHGLEL
jgi:hypothetical protein